VWRGASGGILVPFAISMDYTVFLLSSAKVHWDHIDDAREAMIGGIAHSGRVIFAAAAVMVAVFFTFALSGPLPPKEMGIILGVAVSCSTPRSSACCCCCLHLATWAGGVPGVSALVTRQLAGEMERLDIPPIPEFVEMISDSGAGLYACKASVDLFKLEKEDFIPQVQDIITVGAFYGLAGGGQIIFT
jgi:peroxiredoxin family protein